MFSMVEKEKVVFERNLNKAGIMINGMRPWDLRVHDERLYGRVLSGGSVAAGESYMEGWWDAEALDQFFERIFRAMLQNTFYKTSEIIWMMLKKRLVNSQSIRRSYRVGKQHYDRGIDLFSRMLDKRLNYSCAYWKGAETLDQAQEQKLDLICRKLELSPGMKLLDIGCGWGGLLKYAAENYGIEGTGITVSNNQAEWAQKMCAGLPVTIQMKDYRKLDGTFDRIASVGMAEHVGEKNYALFMQTVSRCLKCDGLFLLQTIGSDRSIIQTDPWIEKYIFPNSMIPSLAQLTRSSEPVFRLEDLHSFGPDYDRTIMAWDENFRSRWSEIAGNYGEDFYRMWRFYLMSSAASFRVRRLQLWQLLFTPHSRIKTVETVR